MNDLPRWPRYRPIRVIGQGGFGTVYLCVDTEPTSTMYEQEVAVKAVSLGALSDEEVLMVMSEVSLLKNVGHPNIITYYDSFLYDDDESALSRKGGATLVPQADGDDIAAAGAGFRSQWLCLVTEYMDGGDLAALLRQYSGQELNSTKDVCEATSLSTVGTAAAARKRGRPSAAVTEDAAAGADQGEVSEGDWVSRSRLHRQRLATTLRAAPRPPMSTFPTTVTKATVMRWDGLDASVDQTWMSDASAAAMPTTPLGATDAEAADGAACGSRNGIQMPTAAASNAAVGSAATGAPHLTNVSFKNTPSNIYLSKRDGTVKIGDFGVSKLLQPAEPFTMTFVGTPFYLCPELCMGDPYSFGADIWALGVVLYELYCLKLPFTSDNVLAQIYVITEGVYDTAALGTPHAFAESQQAVLETLYGPSFLHSERLLHSLVVSMVDKMLQVDPAERPSAEELLTGVFGAGSTSRCGSSAGLPLAPVAPTPVHRPLSTCALAHDSVSTPPQRGPSSFAVKPEGVAATTPQAPSNRLGPSASEQHARWAGSLVAAASSTLQQEQGASRVSLTAPGSRRSRERRDDVVDDFTGAHAPLAVRVKTSVGDILQGMPSAQRERLGNRAAAEERDEKEEVSRAMLPVASPKPTPSSALFHSTVKAGVGSDSANRQAALSPSLAGRERAEVAALPEKRRGSTVGAEPPSLELAEHTALQLLPAAPFPLELLYGGLVNIGDSAVNSTGATGEQRTVDDKASVSTPLGAQATQQASPLSSMLPADRPPAVRTHCDDDDALDHPIGAQTRSEFMALMENIPWLKNAEVFSSIPLSAGCDNVMLVERANRSSVSASGADGALSSATDNTAAGGSEERAEGAAPASKDMQMSSNPLLPVCRAGVVSPTAPRIEVKTISGTTITMGGIRRPPSSRSPFQRGSAGAAEMADAESTQSVSQRRSTAAVHPSCPAPPTCVGDCLAHDGTDEHAKPPASRPDEPQMTQDASGPACPSPSLQPRGDADRQPTAVTVASKGASASHPRLFSSSGLEPTVGNAASEARLRPFSAAQMRATAIASASGAAPPTPKAHSPARAKLKALYDEVFVSRLDPASSDAAYTAPYHSGGTIGGPSEVPDEFVARTDKRSRAASDSGDSGAHFPGDDAVAAPVARAATQLPALEADAWAKGAPVAVHLTKEAASPAETEESVLRALSAVYSRPVEIPATTVPGTGTLMDDGDYGKDWLAAPPRCHQCAAFRRGKEPARLCVAPPWRPPHDSRDVPGLWETSSAEEEADVSARGRLGCPAPASVREEVRWRWSAPPSDLDDTAGTTSEDEERGALLSSTASSSALGGGVIGSRRSPADAHAGGPRPSSLLGSPMYLELDSLILDYIDYILHVIGIALLCQSQLPCFDFGGAASSTDANDDDAEPCAATKRADSDGDEDMSYTYTVQLDAVTGRRHFEYVCPVTVEVVGALPGGCRVVSAVAALRALDFAKAAPLSAMQVPPSEHCSMKQGSDGLATRVLTAEAPTDLSATPSPHEGGDDTAAANGGISSCPGQDKTFLFDGEYHTMWQEDGGFGAAAASPPTPSAPAPSSSLSSLPPDAGATVGFTAVPGKQQGHVPAANGMAPPEGSQSAREATLHSALPSTTNWQPDATARVAAASSSCVEDGNNDGNGATAHLRGRAASLHLSGETRARVAAPLRPSHVALAALSEETMAKAHAPLTHPSLADSDPTKVNTEMLPASKSASSNADGNQAMGFLCDRACTQGQTAVTPAQEIAAVMETTWWVRVPSSPSASSQGLGTSQQQHQLTGSPQYIHLPLSLALRPLRQRTRFVGLLWRLWVSLKVSEPALSRVLLHRRGGAPSPSPGCTFAEAFGDWVTGTTPARDTDTGECTEVDVSQQSSSETSTSLRLGRTITTTATTEASSNSDTAADSQVLPASGSLTAPSRPSPLKWGLYYVEARTWCAVQLRTDADWAVVRRKISEMGTMLPFVRLYLLLEEAEPPQIEQVYVGIVGIIGPGGTGGERPHKASRQLAKYPAQYIYASAAAALALTVTTTLLARHLVHRGEDRTAPARRGAVDGDDDIEFANPAESAFFSYVRRAKKQKEAPLLAALTYLETAVAELVEVRRRHAHDDSFVGDEAVRAVKVSNIDSGGNRNDVGDSGAVAEAQAKVHRLAVAADELLTQWICSLDGVPVRQSEVLKQRRKALVQEAAALTRRISPHLPDIRM
ncbi:Protein kinase domain family protein [Leishmania donovani]|uniref:non-specific serine/threonine protein kinase n=1 Tax=Leishmania donovani TaxID=5661 RepID=A0A504XZW2_LEIDO|nr:Protein kinase domain family protein [Leishmania donovani]